MIIVMVTQLSHPIPSHSMCSSDPSHEDMSACTYAYACRRIGVSASPELNPTSYPVRISQSLSILIHTSISIVIGLCITADSMTGMHHTAAP